METTQATAAKSKQLVESDNREKRAQLTTYEAEVNKGLAGISRAVKDGKTHAREMGEALAKIQKERLFKLVHPTWEGYLRKRWNFTRQRAHQLMGAFNVYKSLTEIVNPVDAKEMGERHARELKALPAPEQKKVIEAVTAKYGSLANVKPSQLKAEIRRQTMSPVDVVTKALVGQFSSSAQLNVVLELVKALDGPASEFEARLTEALKAYQTKAA